MGTARAFLCIFAGCFVAARALISDDGASPLHLPAFFEDLFLFERNFDFPRYDARVGQSLMPDFPMLGELPFAGRVPGVEVFCDESKLLVLVGKRAGDVVLAADDLRLGDNCLSNQDLPNQHVFAYSVDECGTARVMENGEEAFTNTLWANLVKAQAWWPLPSAMSLTCVHKRSFSNPSVFAPTHPDEDPMTIFNFRAADASWSNPAMSNAYERGQVIRFQVSAATRPEWQLFIQSCFISAAPEPHSRPRHSIVTNKGCATLLDSSRSAVQFVSSGRPDVINFAVNTSGVIPELFVHCTVLVSDQAVAPGSKSCNYDPTKARWEDLSGAEEACECCSSRCRGLSLKNVPDEAKAVLSIGPFVVDDAETSPEPLPEIPEASNADSMQSDGPAAVEWVIPGAPMSRKEFSSTPGDVVVVSQHPAASLALWLPGQLEDSVKPADDSKEQVEGSRAQTNDRFEARNSVQKRESENSQTNEIGADDFTKWVETPVKMWQAKFGLFGKRSAGEAPETDGPNMADLEALAQRQAGLAVRSKLKFFKGTDGSQTLSYEEEVVRKDDVTGDGGMKKRDRQGLRSTFLDFIRRLHQAE